MTNALDTDRFLSVAELIERWPIGRTTAYEIIKDPDFPQSLVLLWDRNGRPRSMGFRLSDIVPFEESRMVHPGELSFGDENAATEPVLPPAKRAMPKRSAR
jgi:predicted DNA-binding transcriptional regulator AlpA